MTSPDDDSAPAASSSVPETFSDRVYRSPSGIGGGVLRLPVACGAPALLPVRHRPAARPPAVERPKRSRDGRVRSAGGATTLRIGCWSARVVRGGRDAALTLQSCVGPDTGSATSAGSDAAPAPSVSVSVSVSPAPALSLSPAPAPIRFPLPPRDPS
ncbi:hypothetical protein SANTM175S_08524 [Streptomyces antimycoticus]